MIDTEEFIDTATIEAFLQIADDDGRNLPREGKELIQAANRLLKEDRAVGFLVEDIVRRFGKVVGVNSVMNTQYTWH